MTDYINPAHIYPNGKCGNPQKLSDAEAGVAKCDITVYDHIRGETVTLRLHEGETITFGMQKGYLVAEKGDTISTWKERGE